jgi:hypothetical protein
MNENIVLDGGITVSVCVPRIVNKPDCTCTVEFETEIRTFRFDGLTANQAVDLQEAFYTVSKQSVCAGLSGAALAAQSNFKKASR